MNLASQLEETFASTTAMTEDELARASRIITKRLWDVQRELGQIVKKLGEAHADAERVYDESLIETYAEHEGEKGWTVPRHEAHARRAARDERALEFAYTQMARALHREAESLEHVLVNIAVVWKHMYGVDASFDVPRRAA